MSNRNSDEDRREMPSLYVACKLTGAPDKHIDSIAALITSLNKRFKVLPFQYDFAKRYPVGARQDVLRLDLEKVECAAYMLVILNDDVSDGRGMEVMHRMHQSSQQINDTIVFHKTPIEKLSPMYAGLPGKYAGVTLRRFDTMRRVETLFLEWVDVREEEKARMMMSLLGATCVAPAQ